MANDHRDSIERPFGLDAALKEKRRQSYDYNAEAAVKHWLEQLTGEPFPASFAASLKSGQVLCRAVNAVRPGAIPRIETSSLSFKQMENISHFLRACRALGVKDFECFETLDLVQEKDMGLVVKCIIAFGREIKKSCPDFRGPHLHIGLDMAPVRALLVAGGVGGHSSVCFRCQHFLHNCCVSSHPRLCRLCVARAPTLQPPVNTTTLEQDMPTVFRAPEVHWPAPATAGSVPVSPTLAARPSVGVNATTSSAPAPAPVATASPAAAASDGVGSVTAGLRDLDPYGGIASPVSVVASSSSPEAPPSPPVISHAPDPAPAPAPVIVPKSPPLLPGALLRPPVVVVPSALPPTAKPMVSSPAPAPTPTPTPATEPYSTAPYTPSSSASSSDAHLAAAAAAAAAAEAAADALGSPPVVAPVDTALKAPTPPSNLERARNVKGNNVAADASKHNERAALERSVTAWIEDTAGVVREPVTGFGEWLKSGDVLCTLANALKPGVIAKYNKNTHMPFKMMENLSFFLRAIRTMGVREQECFDTADLFDEKDLLQVLSTLAALARVHNVLL